MSVLILLVFLPGIIFYPRFQSTKTDSLTIALSQSQNDSSKVLTMMEIGKAYSSYNIEKLKFYAEEARQMSNEIGFQKGRIRSLQLLGTYYSRVRNYDSAIYFFRESLRLANDYAFNQEAALCELSIADIFQKTEDFTAAIESYIRAKNYNTPENFELSYLILSGLGNIYIEEENYSEAEKVLKNALILPGLSKLNEGNSNTLLGDIYYSKGKLQDAGDSYKKALSFLASANDPPSQLSLLTKLARVELGSNNYQESLHFLELGDKEVKSLNVSDTLSQKIAAHFRTCKAEVLFRVGDYGNSLGEAKQAVEISNKYQDQENLLESYQIMHKIYASMNDFKDAFDLLVKYQVLNDTLSRRKQKKKIAKMESKFETEKARLQISQLESDYTLKAKTRNYLIGSVGLIFIIGFLAFNRQRLKIKSDSKLIASYNALADSEYRYNQLKKEALLKDLEHQTNELNNHTQTLAEKNNALEEIRKDLISLKKKEIIGKKDIKVVLEKISVRTNTAKNWEEFKHYFKQVHLDFFGKLKDQFPDLSTSELKLCSLIKLNLSTKQASGLLGISATSLKMARYRLRKKLNLTENQNLSSFLMGF